VDLKHERIAKEDCFTNTNKSLKLKLKQLWDKQGMPRPLFRPTVGSRL
jgi:hypothetical protein